MNNLHTLDQIKGDIYGEIGTERRDSIERELTTLKIGLQLRQVREKKKLTQEELAKMVNKKREYISRIENNASNITLKTLYELVEKGLGGKVKISIDI